MLRCIMYNSFEYRLITTEYVWIYLKRPRFSNAYGRKLSQLSKENRNSCNWYISIKIEAWGFKKYVYGVSFFSQCKCTGSLHIHRFCTHFTFCPLPDTRVSYVGMSLTQGMFVL